jgi:hypothetical protein
MKSTLARLGIAPLLFSAGLLLGSSVTGVAFATYQPHMYAANRALHTALGALQAADPDKNGHRLAAIGFVNQAIGEVQAGIAAGNH